MWNKKIGDVCDNLKGFLLAKNSQYGDSAFEPVGIFAKGSPAEMIRVRIDDKLSRLSCGSEAIESDVDVIVDLAGYLILLLTVEGWS